MDDLHPTAATPSVIFVPNLGWNGLFGRYAGDDRCQSFPGLWWNPYYHLRLRSDNRPARQSIGWKPRRFDENRDHHTRNGRHPAAAVPRDRYVPPPPRGGPSVVWCDPGELLPRHQLL